MATSPHTFSSGTVGGGPISLILVTWPVRVPLGLATEDATNSTVHGVRCQHEGAGRDTSTQGDR